MAVVPAPPAPKWASPGQQAYDTAAAKAAGKPAPTPNWYEQQGETNQSARFNNRTGYVESYDPAEDYTQYGKEASFYGVSADPKTFGFNTSLSPYDPRNQTANLAWIKATHNAIQQRTNPPRPPSAPMGFGSITPAGTPAASNGPSTGVMVNGIPKPQEQSHGAHTGAFGSITPSAPSAGSPPPAMGSPFTQGRFGARPGVAARPRPLAPPGPPQ